ncbi:hypothetical protein IC582_010371 [Cucumis melo]
MSFFEGIEMWKEETMSFFEAIEMWKEETILKELICFNLYDGKGISILFVVWISFLILQVVKISLQGKKHLMLSMVKFERE